MASKTDISWGKYLATFFITAVLFASAFWLSSTLGSRRVAEVRSIQNQVAIDLLSSETQFALLSRSACPDNNQTILAPELGALGDRVTFLQGDQGASSEDVLGLKKYYSLLEIKDYLLVTELAKRCAFKPVTILYFYGKDCPDCDKQGYVLTALRETYPDLRVYSFDYNLDLAALKTLQTIYKIDGNLPALVIGERKYVGFKSVSDIEKLLPGLKKPASATSASSSTTTTSP